MPNGHGGSRANSGRKEGWQDRQAARRATTVDRAIKACERAGIDPYETVCSIIATTEDERIKLDAAKFMCLSIEPQPRAASVSRVGQAPPAIITLNFSGEPPPVTIDQPMNGEPDPAAVQVNH